MAALKSADAMVRQQLSDGVQNSFDHNVHHFNVELKHAFQVHVADPILKAYAKMRDTKDNENTETQYHGTDYGGAIGIVRTGYNLKFTKNGRMLGNGTYVTPVSSKSLQYLMGHVGRGDGRGILFVNKISWGRIKENGSYSYSYEPFDSTHASKSGSLRNDESCIHNPKCLYPEYWLDMQRIGQPW